MGRVGFDVDPEGWLEFTWNVLLFSLLIRLVIEERGDWGHRVTLGK